MLQICSRQTKHCAAPHFSGLAQLFCLATADRRLTVQPIVPAVFQQHRIWLQKLRDMLNKVAQEHGFADRQLDCGS